MPFKLVDGWFSCFIVQHQSETHPSIDQSLIAGVVIALAYLIAVSVVAVPFTKVEESFNVQATHDILYHGLDIDAYDHLEFPGVVPRTFLGPLALSLPLLPLRYITTLVGLPKQTMLIALRLALGLASLTALVRLRSAVSATLGPDVGIWLMLLTAIQFHAPFYMSRTLPNTFATIITTWGLAEWVEGRRPHHSLALLTFAAIVFRCDAIMLAGLVGLQLLFVNKNVGFWSGVKTGVITAVAAIATTVLVDSFFWKRWLWPEGEVFYFNAILNKSHEWGVSPPLWYFTSALPRALHACFPLALLGPAVDRRVRPYFWTALAFVSLYSNLGHKELRFLFPVLPLWTLSAAAAMAQLRRLRKHSLLWTLVYAGAVAGLAVGVGTVAMGFASAHDNYPGGVALQRLHHREASHTLHSHPRIDGVASLKQYTRNVSVHIAVFPAMTGISRFGQEREREQEQVQWIYSKEEGLNDAALKRKRFDYLLSDKVSVKGYTVVDVVDAFGGWRVVKNGGGGGGAAMVQRLLQERVLPVALRMVRKPAVYIHKRNDGSMDHRKLM